MNPLHHDLQALTAGEVHTDAVTREVYATAACIYRIAPRAVVCPGEADEISAIVAYAAERGIPITARGAGTSVAGQALGPGIVIDFRRHLNQILVVNYEAREAIVEPGLVLGHLNRELARYRLQFPPDPSSGDYATIGGMIANNSSGAHSLKYGDTRAWTDRVKAVLSDGTVTWLEPKPALPAGLAGSSHLENKIYARLPELLKRHQTAIAAGRPRTLKNSSGYHLWDLISGDRINPTPLIVGSEGTLAITVKAALRLAPVPAARGAALMFFDELEAAGDAVAALRGLAPAALEIMDGRVLEIVRRHRPDLANLAPAGARAALLIEFEGDAEREIQDRLDRTAKVVTGLLRPGAEIVTARHSADIAKLFAVRKASSPILYRLPGRRLTRFIEDIVVPPDRLVEAMKQIESILAEHGTDAPILGHAGSGNLHLNPRLNLEDPADRDRMTAIADQVYAAVIALGGSLTGEHGDGILRAPYLKKQFPDLVPLFREIKDLFDPGGVLNPGKILSESESIPREPLRFPAAPETITDASWRPDPALIEMLLRCHGCGLCRTFCPVAQATNAESDLPRSRISVLRAALLGDLDYRDPEIAADLQRLINLCTQCQRCTAGCPTGIEPFKLVRAFLDELYRRGGRPLREKFFAASPAALGLASRAPDLISAIIGSRLARTLIERGIGIRKNAPFPALSHDTSKMRPGNNARPSRTQVALYPGCIGRYADDEGVTRAAADVLARLGYDVIMPDLPCCGEARLLTGDLAGARKNAQAFAEKLARTVPAGVPVIATCFACALVFRREYPDLIGNMSETVTPRVIEFFEFLARENALRDFALVAPSPEFSRARVHVGCHQSALGLDGPALSILKNIKGLELSPVVNACCGLAGYHGMRLENAPVSAALAQGLLTALGPDRDGPIISACSACRLQLEVLGLSTLSPIILLSRTFGIMPPS